MQLFTQENNKLLWHSEKVSKELLKNLFQLLDELGLHDCTSIDNIPFSLDGRIAFIDTQTFNKWPIDFSELTHFLSNEMKTYWNQLTKKKK